MRHTKPAHLFLSFVFSVALLGCSLGGLVATEEYSDDEYDVVEVTDEPSEGDEQTGGTGENGRIARQHLEALTAIGARWSGSAEERQAGQYIVSAFREMGYESEFQPFTDTGDEGETINSANIIAVKDGNSTEVIVVGAHYDSSDEGLGSDDNGSGVAILLETAELVANRSTPYTIYFVAFGSEEAGLLGSYAFASSLSDDETSNIILFVNMDSLSVGDVTYIYSGRDTAALDWAVDWAGASGYELEPIPNADLADEDGYATADYGAFDEAGIPWIYFEATNWELGAEDGYTQVDLQYGDEGAIMHTEYDDLAYFDEVFPGRVEYHLDLYVSVLYALLSEYE